LYVINLDKNIQKIRQTPYMLFNQHRQFSLLRIIE
jgi:hypothetical protein